MNGAGCDSEQSSLMRVRQQVMHMLQTVIQPAASATAPLTAQVTHASLSSQTTEDIFSNQALIHGWLLDGARHI